MYAEETKLIVAVSVAAVLVALVVSGCGGGAGVATLGGGSVSGYIQHIVTGQGIGGMLVTIGGRQGTSTTPNGAFVVTGITPSLSAWPIVVTPTPLLASAGSIPPVLVAAEEAYALPAPILVGEHDPPSYP